MITPTSNAAALAGRTVLVTGGARRVGAEIARTLHAAGAQVAVHFRNSTAEAEALVAALNGVRPQSEPVYDAY